MIYAVLSDIHANWDALQRILEDSQRLGAEAYLICGDIVGYGAQPNECCETVRALHSCVIVRGNHDEAAINPAKEDWFNVIARECIRWTRKALTPENLAFLESLPPTARIPGAHLCHGSLPDPDLYTTTPEEALLTFAEMEEPLCFLGHTHFAEWFVLYPPTSSPGEQSQARSSRAQTRSTSFFPLPHQFSRPQGGRLELKPGRRYIVNPGAVGQPRDGNSQAAYAIWDTEKSYIEIRRLSYDIEATQRKILAAGLPPSMAERLRFGV